MDEKQEASFQLNYRKLSEIYSLVVSISGHKRILRRIALAPLPSTTALETYRIFKLLCENIENIKMIEEGNNYKKTIEDKKAEIVLKGTGILLGSINDLTTAYIPLFCIDYFLERGDYVLPAILTGYIILGRMVFNNIFGFIGDTVEKRNTVQINKLESISKKIEIT